MRTGMRTGSGMKHGTDQATNQIINFVTWQYVDAVMSQSGPAISFFKFWLEYDVGKLEMDY